MKNENFQIIEIGTFGALPIVSFSKTVADRGNRRQITENSWHNQSKEKTNSKSNEIYKFYLWYTLFLICAISEFKLHVSSIIHIDEHFASNCIINWMENKNV